MRVIVLQKMIFDELHRSRPRQYCIFAYIRRSSCVLVAVLGALIGTEFITEFRAQLHGQSIRQRSG